MTQASNLSKFKAFLTTNSVPAVVIEFMTKAEAEGGLELGSITDYASAFKDDNYEDEIKEKIVDKTPAKDSITALGRTRTAWVLARAELKKAAKAVGEGTSSLDLDAPLGEAEETARKDQFDGSYSNLTFEPESTPAGTITARFF